MKRGIIIVAGGNGKRMQSDLPKQFIDLQGNPILMHTIKAFYNFDKNIEIVLALPEMQIEFWKNLCEKLAFKVPHKIVAGGEERFFSVKNALAVSTADFVAIHDGVRPLVSQATIARTFAAAEQHGAAIPVAPLTESIRVIENNESHALDRSKFRTVQTPQIFRCEILQNAYNQFFSSNFTDDASVVESAGYKIALVEGNQENIKITTKIDLLIADIVIRNS